MIYLMYFILIKKKESIIFFYQVAIGTIVKSSGTIEYIM